MRTIAALGREREMTAGQLAKSADLTPATVTAILDQLETAGIVERRRSTSDRRVCNVSLTTAGWELLERKLAAFHALWAERLSEFSDEELETAIRVVGRAADVLETLGRRLDGTDAAPPGYSSSGDSSTP
jgi:DNA-binding MarR family transcriptional regulator